MNEGHIRGLDLNLLRVFDALYEERNVTRAARRLGLTQSAVSHALNRLRYTLGDELFVRGPSGMRATPRAAEIGPRIREGLLQLSAALSPDAFTPAETERSFSVATGNYACAVLLPEVMRTVRMTAPRAQVKIRNGGLGLAEDLDAGRTDLAIGAFTLIPDRFASLPLFTDRMVWVVRADHPLVAGPKATLTVEGLRSLAHVIIATAEDGYVVDGSVSDSGLERRAIWDDEGALRRAWEAMDGADSPPPPAFTVPDTHSALAFLAQTDMAALLPERLAKVYAPLLGLTLFDPPYPTAMVQIVMLWRREHDAPALAWLRDLVRQAAQALAGV
jgi:DNA-binding transcriptional LysR family regulator